MDYAKIGKALFSGCAIVIDDAFKTSNSDDPIMKIVFNLQEEGIPIVTFDSVPDDKVINHLRNVNFILLDWDLLGLSNGQRLDGVQLGEESRKESECNTLAFLKKIRDKLFAPVLIFSSGSKHDIIKSLVEEKLFHKSKSESCKNWIMVEEKNSVIGSNDLFTKIGTWAFSHPAIHCLKHWEKKYYKAKHETFLDLIKATPLWPKVLWKSFKSDGANPAREINNLIYVHLRGRTQPLDIDEDGLSLFDDASSNVSDSSLTHEEILEVISKSQILNRDRIDENSVVPGDIFYLEKKIVTNDLSDSKMGYFVNIRAECDTILSRSAPGTVQLYLLPADTIRLTEIKNKNFDEKNGSIRHPTTQHLVLYAHEKRNISINFKLQYTCSIDKVLSYRIARILPPYSTQLQQRYAMYMCRLALPRVPNEIFSEMPPTEIVEVINPSK